MPADAAVIAAIVILFAIFVLYLSVRIVREYQRLVVFRLGRVLGEKGPGLVFLIPFVDRAVWVDLREVFLEVPSQTCITKDNAPIDIDFLIYWKVTDPVSSVIRVGNFAGASQGIATTTLRAVIGDILLDDVLARREDINKLLRTKLDEVTERWGVKVTSVEIREIKPPREVQMAMNRQLAAEGERQATILRAEGERQAAILRAEGFALALEKIYSAAKEVDAKTMALQYLDALRAIGASPATKFVIPLEFTSLLGPLRAYVGSAAPSPGDGGAGEQG
jgi:regulator of protease activity HflC (stomatin/prohibitin superfamily)